MWVSTGIESQSSSLSDTSNLVALDKKPPKIMFGCTCSFTKQLVFATGMSGVPNIPEVPGAHLFEGDIHHSSKHKDGSIYKGKNCVILGSNNSAHDISANLWEKGANVTMLQRSPSMVVKSESLFRNSPYSESAEQKGISTHKVDMIDASLPWKLNAETSIEELANLKEKLDGKK